MLNDLISLAKPITSLNHRDEMNVSLLFELAMVIFV